MHFLIVEDEFLMHLKATYLKAKDTDFSDLATQDKVSDHSNLKILTPKQILKIFSIAIAQVKACNTFENLLSEIGKIIYFLHRAKEITKKVYNNIMNSIKL